MDLLLDELANKVQNSIQQNNKKISDIDKIVKLNCRNNLLIILLNQLFFIIMILGF